MNGAQISRGTEKKKNLVKEYRRENYNSSSSIRI